MNYEITMTFLVQTMEDYSEAELREIIEDALWEVPEFSNVQLIDTEDLNNYESRN